MRTFRAGLPIALILVGSLAAACITTLPAATAPPATPTAPAPATATATPSAPPPTAPPTAGPTVAPTSPPTEAPTVAPTTAPTDTPTDAPTDSPTDQPTSTSSGWTANAVPYRGTEPQRYTIVCPPGGSPGTIWGTTFYTDDSSICTAAVHRGDITLASGGTVTFEIAPGQESYEGSEQNGIISRDWGSWVGTFVIVID